MNWFNQHPDPASPEADARVTAARPTDLSGASVAGSDAALAINYRPVNSANAELSIARPRIKYRDSENALREVLLTDAAASDVASGHPVRRIQSRRGARGMVGFWWTARLYAKADSEVGSRRLLPTESTVEARFLLAAEFNDSIRSVTAQPFRILAPGQPCHNHVPDFLVIYNDGTAVVCDVRPKSAYTASDAKVSDSFRNEIAAVGWRHLVWHDLDPVVHDNLSWLSRVRRDGVAHPRAVALARELLDNDTYGSLERKIIDAGVPSVFVRPGIDRLIWTGEIRIDLTKNLDIDTILHLAGSDLPSESRLQTGRSQ